MKRPHSKVTLKVSRHALLESVSKVSSLSKVIKVFQLGASLIFGYILQVIFFMKPSLLFKHTCEKTVLLFDYTKFGADLLEVCY